MTRRCGRHRVVGYVAHQSHLARRCRTANPRAAGPSAPAGRRRRRLRSRKQCEQSPGSGRNGQDRPDAHDDATVTTSRKINRMTRRQVALRPSARDNARPSVSSYDAIVTIRFANCARAISTHLLPSSRCVRYPNLQTWAVAPRRPHFCRHRRACQFGPRAARSGAPGGWTHPRCRVRASRGIPRMACASLSSVKVKR